MRWAAGGRQQAVGSGPLAADSRFNQPLGTKAYKNLEVRIQNLGGANIKTVITLWLLNTKKFTIYPML
jgi:hypothetical protein